jgi:hypothetical protein
VLQERQLRTTLADEGRLYARDWSSLSMARRLAELYHRTRELAGARAAARFNTALSGGV